VACLSGIGTFDSSSSEYKATEREVKDFLDDGWIWVVVHNIHHFSDWIILNAEEEDDIGEWMTLVERLHVLG
jgi:hypothetical protein